MKSKRLDDIIKELRDEIDSKQFYINEQTRRIKEADNLINERLEIIKKLEELK